MARARWHFVCRGGPSLVFRGIKGSTVVGKLIVAEHPELDSSEFFHSVSHGIV